MPRKCGYGVRFDTLPGVSGGYIQRIAAHPDAGWAHDVDGNKSVIWTKTDAGRTEIQARALVKERAQRTLLLLIDGIKSDELLLASLGGISGADFEALQALGLIACAPAPAPSARPAGSSPGRTAAGPATTPGGLTPGFVTPPPLREAESAPLDYAQFTATLTRLISSELGLRGFVLTLAVEKAGTIEELQAVAQRTVTQIRERKGDAAAAAARRALYGI